MSIGLQIYTIIHVVISLAGIGSGAAVLGVMLMLGIVAPLLVPVLGIAGIIMLITIVTAWAAGCT